MGHYLLLKIYQSCFDTWHRHLLTLGQAYAGAYPMFRMPSCHMSVWSTSIKTIIYSCFGSNWFVKYIDDAWPKSSHLFFSGKVHDLLPSSPSAYLAEYCWDYFVGCEYFLSIAFPHAKLSQACPPTPRTVVK